MLALRRALLGSVILWSIFEGVLGGVSKGYAAQTAWAQSFQKALAARGMSGISKDGSIHQGIGQDSGQSQEQENEDDQHNVYPQTVQEGLASWYGGRGQHLHRRTSFGVIFDKHALTAAHPTAPFGSHLRVTSEETGRSVIVTVNDRGPYARGRVIDLSRAAAIRIGMLGTGVAHVRIEPVVGEDSLGGEDMGREETETAITRHRAHMRKHAHYSHSLHRHKHVHTYHHSHHSHHHVVQRHGRHIIV
ncbi:MAG: septal ring lytic transglycosylase RlpA family protein [Acetobacter sp.]|nr:septal ring lytic transglycosylase RlpA family protein [Acetobacter sp.]